MTGTLIFRRIQTHTTMSKLVAGWLLLLIGLAQPAAGQAERIQIPIALEQPFIESLLREQVFTGAGGSLRLHDDGSGCQFLQLNNNTSP